MEYSRKALFSRPITYLHLALALAAFYVGPCSAEKGCKPLKTPDFSLSSAYSEGVQEDSLSPVLYERRPDSELP